MFYADLDEGRIVRDEELKERYIQRQPYKTWVETHQIELGDLGQVDAVHQPNPEIRLSLQQTFGYTLEDMRFLLAPMAANGKEALGSMGEDSAESSPMEPSASFPFAAIGASRKRISSRVYPKVCWSESRISGFGWWTASTCPRSPSSI